MTKNDDSEKAAGCDCGYPPGVNDYENYCSRVEHEIKNFGGPKEAIEVALKFFKSDDDHDLAVGFEYDVPPEIVASKFIDYAHEAIRES